MYIYTYKTTNLINNKVYIGSHRSNIHPDLDPYFGGSRSLRQDIIKLGQINFRKEVIEWYDTVEEARKGERKLVNEDFIKQGPNKVYNKVRGGSGLKMVSDETRKRMSIAKKNISDETRKRMSIAKNNITDDQRYNMHLAYLRRSKEVEIARRKKIGEANRLRWAERLAAKVSEDCYGGDMVEDMVTVETVENIVENVENMVVILWRCGDDNVVNVSDHCGEYIFIESGCGIYWWRYCG